MSQHIESRPTSESLQWTCPQCGTPNVTGDICPNCGAFHDASTPAKPAFSSPSATATALTPHLFLLDEGNRAFVEGRARNIVRSWAPFYTIVFVVVFGGIFAIIGFREWSIEQALSTEGHVTQGTIAGHHTYQTHSKNGSTNHYVLNLGFKATAGKFEGTPYVVAEEVSGNTYFRLNVGAPVSVVFLPTDPTTARLAGADTDTSGQFSIWLALAIVGLLCLFIGFQARQMLRNRRLTRTGKLLSGEMIACTGSSSKNTFTVALDYSFISPLGTPLKRTERGVRNDLRGRLPAPPRSVAVLYLSDQIFRVM